MEQLMGMLKTVAGFFGEIFTHNPKEMPKRPPKKEPDEILIRVKEGHHAGMKLDYGWTARPLADFLGKGHKQEKLPPFVKVMIDVPEGMEQEEVKIAPIGEKLTVKVPGRKRKEMDMPYAVKDEYETRIENNVLIILLRREDG